MIETLPPTTTVADVLLMHGLSGCLTPPLRTIAAPGVPVCGPAVTVEFAPGAVDGGFDSLYALLSSDDIAGRVLVIAGLAGVPGAAWGQILSRAASRRGAVAAVVDGAVRDVDLLGGEWLAVCAASVHTAGAPAHAHVAAIGAGVRIGDTPVEQDDVVLVDGAGAVRLPREQADMLLAQARALAVAEDRVLAELAAGHPLSDAYHHKRTAQAAIRAELQRNGTSPR